MAGNKYIALVNGGFAETQATQTTTGAADAGKIVALDAAGLIPASMMPVGVGADTNVLTASEALSAGSFVNVWNNAGTPSVRKADATTAGKEAHGFVLSAVSASAPATVYFEGSNTALSGLTAGPVFLATTAGTATATAPSATGNVVQCIGVAVSATTINFQANRSVVLA